MSLLEQARRIAEEFEVSSDNLERCVQYFRLEMANGLSQPDSELSQLPTYVTSLPTGTEKGTFLAVDLGGTNLRVCSVALHGDHTFTLKNSHVKVPKELKQALTAHELFSFIAEQIREFLNLHHSDHLETIVLGQSDKPYFELGVTFSFPVSQHGINKGILIRWTKGFNIREAVGQDVCSLLQTEIDELRLPVKVCALVNDTVGTLMSRCYTKPGRTNTLIGAIFGTGTNGAYVEDIYKIKKLPGFPTDEGHVSSHQHMGTSMIINTEWGSFDNALKVLPSTIYDQTLDEESVNPGMQMLEKRISGLFLGEILRLVLLGLYKSRNDGVFRAGNADTTEYHSIADGLTSEHPFPLLQPYAIDSSILSIVEGDDSSNLAATRSALASHLGVYHATHEECMALKILVHAIGKRAVRLSAVALAAIVLSSGRLSPDNEKEKEQGIDIGMDGSLAEHYPGFEQHLREALREIDGLGDGGEKRLTIGLCKDGSGLGAALAALMARTEQEV